MMYSMCVSHILNNLKHDTYTIGQDNVFSLTQLKIQNMFLVYGSALMYITLIIFHLL